MQTYTSTKTPDFLSLIDLVAENPQRASQVGVSLIVLGVAVLVLVAIFSS